MTKDEVESTLQKVQELIPELQQLADHIRSRSSKTMTTASMRGWGTQEAILGLRMVLEDVRPVRHLL